jgi:hypothetical protein
VLLEEVAGFVGTTTCEKPSAEAAVAIAAESAKM